jgi:hypothetical protein
VNKPKSTKQEQRQESVPTAPSAPEEVRQTIEGGGPNRGDQITRLGTLIGLVTGIKLSKFAFGLPQVCDAARRLRPGRPTGRGLGNAGGAQTRECHRSDARDSDDRRA